MSESNEDNQTSDAWDPRAQLRARDSAEVQLSRGFLRSRPEKWFPALATHWLPLAHSLGVELQMMEVRPALRATRGLGKVYYGELNGERLVFYCDAESCRVILSGVTPGVALDAEEIVLEYLVRRFFASLGLSWSGAETTQISFTGKAATLDLNESGAVKLTLSINNQTCIIWLLLGEKMVDQLDRLWRRQIQSSSRLAEVDQTVELELAQVSVSQSELSTLLRVGGRLVIESPFRDMITLRKEGRVWLPARLCTVDDNFGIEIVAAPAHDSVRGDSKVKLSVLLGSITVAPSLLSEITQPGALFDTSIPISGMVTVVMHDKEVGRGVLEILQGQLSVRITQI